MSAEDSMRMTQKTPLTADQSVDVNNEGELYTGKPLAVLFSHSSRIRCFMDMLYPIGRDRSIYQLMKDYKKDYKKENKGIAWRKKLTRQGVKTGTLKIKFNNCVVFVLKQKRGRFFLCMKHAGIGNRINIDHFKKILGFGENEPFNNETYIQVQINKGGKTMGEINDINPSNKLIELLEQKDLCIIRHGLSTHNLGGGSHLYTDSSLTKKGMEEAEEVAGDIYGFLNNYNYILNGSPHILNNINTNLYVSELFRTQQTAMIFANICHVNSFEKIKFTSSAIFPIPLIVVPCNHEFSESHLESGSCYKNQSERANFTKSFWKKENLPEHRPDWIKKRTNVTFQSDENEAKSFFHLDTSLYSSDAQCENTVFFYMNKNLTPYTNDSPDTYTEMSIAAGYDFKKDEYINERSSYFLNHMKTNTPSLRSWGGRSLNKKRKTLRRTSKRLTQKRNRRTNKRRKTKRFTNKRRKNKRFTKRR